MTTLMLLRFALSRQSIDEHVPVASVIHENARILCSVVEHRVEATGADSRVIAAILDTNTFLGACGSWKISFGSVEHGHGTIFVENWPGILLRRNLEARSCGRPSLAFVGGAGHHNGSTPLPDGVDVPRPIDW